VKYIPEAVFEARAGELWRSYGLEPGFDIEDLVDRLGLSLLWEAVPDPDGGVVFGMLDPNNGRIVLNELHIAELESNPGLLRYTIGHELGHWLFHAEAARSGTLSLFQDGRIWCRDGSRDPAERQAEMFSARLLMPRDMLKPAFPEAGWRGWRDVYALAETFAVSATAMIIRLEELGWAHRDQSGEPRRGPATSPGQTQLLSP
jgi:Zn-dependent peptidase ImmA (M78 family)